MNFSANPRQEPTLKSTRSLYKLPGYQSQLYLKKKKKKKRGKASDFQNHIAQEQHKLMSKAHILTGIHYFLIS